MKKNIITLFLALASVINLHAAITYEHNGGITNDYRFTPTKKVFEGARMDKQKARQAMVEARQTKAIAPVAMTQKQALPIVNNKQGAAAQVTDPTDTVIGLQYDMTEGSVERTYSDADVVKIDTDYVAQYGQLYFDITAADGSDMISMVFFVEEADAEIGIPAGVYTIDDSGDYGTVYASPGLDNMAVTPSFYANLTPDGYLEVPCYFMVSGQVVVENVNGALKVTIDALNSYDVPVHIVYDATPASTDTTDGTIVFDADVDQGNAGTDSNNAAAYQITKSGVTMEVSSGILGTYNNEMHYRVFKEETLTLTSTVGKIVKIEFTCTANDDSKYGPGCLTVDGGEYTYAGAVGTWTGAADAIVFTATTNQVRATQLVVTIEGSTTPDTDVVNVTNLSYADAYYMEGDGATYWDFQLFNVDESGESFLMPIVLLGVEAKSKTALNGTYDLLLALYGNTLNEETYEVDGVYNDKTIAATLTIKNVNEEGDYSFVGTFVGEDGKTYKINTVANVYAMEDATKEEIELKEDGINDPVTPPTPDGAVTFDADVDQGNAGTDSNNATAYQITKSGVTMEVSGGILGTYNYEMHYRVFKEETLTLTSTVGKIVKVEFTCTANDDSKYGPGCLTVDGGEYTYAGAVGTWTGAADAIVFTATTNQVRANQVVVTIEGAEIPETPENPEGVITCAQAVEICEVTGETPTTETYTIHGYVTEIKTAYFEGYDNISFWMADTPDGGQVLLAFRVKPVNTADINVAIGDYVEVVGTLVNYSGKNPEVNAGGIFTIITPTAITYELNGGVTNDYGWMSKSDMFQACMEDAYGYDIGVSLNEFKQDNNPYIYLLSTLEFNVSHCQNILDNSRWDWLEDYLVMIQEESVAATLTKGHATADWRYAIAAFFFEGQYSTSSDYSQFGKYEEYILAWKHAYDNPTSPKKEWTLNAPYKEGATFEGWYTTANFTGDQVTAVNASTTGTLYAKWEENQVAIITVENAVVEIKKHLLFGDVYDYSLKMTGEWINPEEGLTYPVLVEVPVYYPDEIEPYDTLSTVTIGDWSDNDPWLGFGEGELTITTVDDVVTVTGIIENQQVGIVIDITISGKLPTTEVPCEDIFTTETITACGSYTWNDSTYAQSGEYIYTTTATNGCDSTITLHLTINQAQYAEETITACDSYEWNGQTYTQSGDYTYSTTAINGCDSIVTLHLTINYSEVGETEYVTIDNGETYTWNGQTYSTAGEYSVTLSNANGCDSVATLHLTINSDEYASRTEEAICYGDSYLWEVDGNWYEEEGTYYATNEEGEHVLELIVYPPTEDTEEYATIAFGETYWWNDMEYDEAGTYTEILYDENGCEYTATLYLTVMEDDSCPIYMCNNREFLSVDDCAWYALDLAELSNGEDLRIVITNEWGGEFAQCDMTLYVERNETAASIFEIYETLQHGQMLDTLVPRSLFEQYEKLYLQISVDASLNILFTYYMPCTQENSMPYTWGTEVSTDGEDAGTYHIDLEQLRAQNQSVELTITNSSDENSYLWMFGYEGNCSYNQCLEDPKSSLDVFATMAKSTSKWIIDLAQKNETSTDHYFAAIMFSKHGFFDETILSGNWVMNPVESRTTLCQNAESIKSGWIYHLQANEQRYFQLDSADIYTIDTIRYISLTIENLSDTPIECTYSTGICGMEQVMPTITLSAYESKIVPVQLSSYFALMEYNGDYNLGIHTTGDVRVQCTIDGIAFEPQHQLCYTSSDGNIIIPYNINAFGANIVSNTYTNGRGVILFDAPITNIGNAAFYNCTKLASIQLPNTVLAIRQDAFTGCNQLTELTIPANVMTIDRNFIKTQDLTTLIVDSGNQIYDSRNNCNAIIETASNRLLKGCRNTIIPNTVEIIGNNAFADCTALTQIVIPVGVSTIEYGAFSGCSAVETIRVFATTPPTLESNAFGNIPSTTPVYVPCSSLNLYREAVHWSSIFSNIQCASVTICHGESYTWDINGETYTESGVYTHTTNYGEETLYLMVLPEVPATEIVERICFGTTYPIGEQEYATTGDYTITLTDQYGCDSVINLHLTVLPEVIIEELKDTISSEETPYEWRGNTYTTTGRYTQVEQYAQTDCDSIIHILDLIVLTTGNYEETYDTICQSQLPYVWYNQELTTSGKYSYTEQYVGSSVDSIQHILNLTVIETEYSDEYQTICYNEIYIWNGQTYSTAGEYSVVLTNTNGCDSIATLHLTILPEVYPSEEFVTICHNETYSWNGQTYSTAGDYNITLANANGCDSIAILHLFVLPSATTETTNVDIEADKLPYQWHEKWYNESGVYYDSVPYSEYACDSVIYILRLTVNTSNMCGEHLIWEYHNGVLNIKGSGAMYDNPDLLSYRNKPWYPDSVNYVALPNAITHIGNVAFADCSNLTSIKIPSSVTSIGDGAFSWTGLLSVTIPASVTELGEQVFETCNNLHTILYEGTPSSISNQTVHPFIGCVHLDTIITPAELWHCTNADPVLEARYGVPNKARYIEVTNGFLTNQALAYITQSITTLKVLDLTYATNTTLPYGALSDSYQLTTLYLPQQIEVIPESMIEGGRNLTEVLIPATVTEIGNNAFAGCTNVWRMTVEAILPPKVYANTFDGIDRTISLIVPAGSEDLYRQAEYWREFFIEHTDSPLPISNCQKLLHEDHILILREGKVYTTMGQLLK